MKDKRERPAIQEALEDHHHLLEIQKRLLGHFVDGSCPAFQAWIQGVRDELKEMVQLLDEHFRHEEEEGLHEEIAEALPNASLRLDGLLGEHQTLLSRVKGLGDQAAATTKPGEDGALRAAASEFFALLDEHERAERELFLAALEGEGGAPD